MAVKFLQNLDQSVDTNTIKSCKSCGLYINQLPILDSQTQASIFWVGLSAVQFDDDEEKLPLSPLTRSGALIESIELSFKNQLNFYKTNLVKCLPLNGVKIRYPIEQEMDKCFPNFELEMKSFQPSIVFLLGKQVSSFVLKRYGHIDINFSDEFEYKTFIINNITFVPIHHPSYILVYKRKSIEIYKKAIQSFFKLPLKNNLLENIIELASTR